MSEAKTAVHDLEVVSLDKVRLSLSEVRPHPKNPRFHSPEQIEALQESLRLDGYIAGSMAIQQSTKMLYKGHGVYEALLGLGCKYADFVVKDLTDAETLALLARDNALSDMSTNDPVKLKAISVDLQEMNVPIQRMGYTLKEITSMQPKREVVEDEPPEVSDEVVSKTGDLWRLGKHRVLCGDSTKAEDVERVMGGEKADMVFTDPPYGVSIVQSSGVLQGKGSSKGLAKNRGYTPIHGDEQTPDIVFLLDLAPVQIIFGANYFADQLPLSSGWIVWDKRSEAIKSNSFGDCEVAWSNLDQPMRIYRCVWHGMIKEGESGRRIHPTQKPVKLLVAIMQSYERDLILDPFLGSGTTLIAADQLDRICYGIEIAPKYVDVIVKRYIAHSLFDSAGVSVERNGKTLTWEQARLPKVV